MLATNTSHDTYSTITQFKLFTMKLQNNLPNSKCLTFLSQIPVLNNEAQIIKPCNYHPPFFPSPNSNHTFPLPYNSIPHQISHSLNPNRTGHHSAKP